MKKVLLLALLVLASASAEAQDYLYGLPMYRGPVSAMGACEAAKPRLWVTTDSTAAGNCAEGSGSAQVLCLCSGGAWAAVGGGSGSLSDLPVSFNYAPASAHSYDCEFNSLCAGWSTYGTVGTGTVSPTSTASGDPIYDLSTWPGWALFQSDESSGTIYGLKRASVTLDTNATIFFHAWTTIKDQAANEGAIGLGLFNSSDANEWIYLAIDSGTGNLVVYDGVNNNGTVGYTNRLWPNDLAYGTGSFYGAIVKAGNDYHFWVWLSDGGFPHYLGSRTKTGVTTFDEFRFYVITSNDSPRVISGLDFVRYYSSATFALSNGAP